MTDHIHSRRFHTPRALPRWGWVLALLALMLGGVVRAEEAPMNDYVTSHGTLCESSREVPQWQDVGLEDLLVVSSQPSVPTARPMRQVYALGGELCQRVLAHTPKATEHAAWVVASRSVPGCFIYFLLSLRL